MFCFGFLFFFPRAPHLIRRSPRTAQPLTLLANSCGASGLPEKRIRRRREQPTSIYTLQQLRVAFGESARATCAPSRLHFLRKTLALAGPFARRTELRPRTERERSGAALLARAAARRSGRINRGASGLRAAFDSRSPGGSSPGPPSAPNRRAPTPHKARSEATLAMQRNENTAYFSISRFDVRYQRPFLLLSSPDQRLLLFLLLLLILFSALIAQSSLTMTLMLMRWLERVVLMSRGVHQRSSGVGGWWREVGRWGLQERE